MKNVAVIGAGTMGNGIAQVFAMNGYSVTLIDVSVKALGQAIETIIKNTDRMVAKGSLTEVLRDSTLKNIVTSPALKSCADSDLVVEAATESIELKLKVFRELDEICKPETILASNTSSISITKIGSVTRRADKVIGMHFMNPVPLMKLIEVIKGYATSDETLEVIMETSKKLGKTPVEVNDYPGFVANRILLPMINEAIFALFENVAGVEEIDTVMKLGMAHPMGPLQLADFIGLDVCLAILRVLYEGLGNQKYAPCPLLEKMVTAGYLGVKTGEGFYNYALGAKEPVISARFIK
jgi:3-hydroxybutyryl-CoA dehydrogenase